MLSLTNNKTVRHCRKYYVDCSDVRQIWIPAHSNPTLPDPIERRGDPMLMGWTDIWLSTADIYDIVEST